MNTSEFVQWATSHGWSIRSVLPTCVVGDYNDGRTTRTWIKQEGGWWKVAHRTGRPWVPGAERKEED